ncbi:MAG: hypothetical protein QOI42_101 [Frankiaceae bacterium]|nr:hypothetical protein [Frankiaceae bacterium]
MTPTGTCAECGFAWDMSYDDAVTIVGRAPSWFAKAFQAASFEAPPPGVWTAGAYLWHVVDVVRYGTERLWSLSFDPAAGVPVWDADVMAAARAYEGRSVRVGLHALEVATEDWLVAAGVVPRNVTAVQPQSGAIDARTSVVRNAHEVVHHVLDVRRQRV